MFSSRGGRAGLTQGIRQLWIPYPCDTILHWKSTGPVFKFKFRHNFFEIFSLKHLWSHPCAKVFCQIPDGSDCFGSLIPRIFPPTHTHFRGKALMGASYRHFTNYSSFLGYSNFFNFFMVQPCKLIARFSSPASPSLYPAPLIFLLPIIIVSYKISKFLVEFSAGRIYFIRNV